MSTQAPRRGPRHLTVLAGVVLAVGLHASPAPAQTKAKADEERIVRHDSSPYVPTPQRVVDEMLRMGRVGAKDFVIDLGSGDGRIVITAAQKLGARGFGVDLDPELVRYANAAAKQAGVTERAQFFQRDIFQTELAQADVVTMYLLPEVNMLARPKLLAELRPGTRVVTHDYHFEDWLPDDRITLDVPEKKVGTPGLAYIYVWIVPGQGAGRWQGRMPVGGQMLPVDFELEQRFQILTGKANVGGRFATIVFGEMVGNEMRLVLTVEVNGRSMRHELRAPIRGDEGSGTVAVGADTVVQREPLTITRTARRAAYFGDSSRSR
ncbi:MAG: class I SAM-dependent methyltransferase [Proteobacteria bacterium]|nr:class I SAM-dependent methyltransferase [Burkholderiales bacterium]